MRSLLGLLLVIVPLHGGLIAQAPRTAVHSDMDIREAQARDAARKGELRGRPFVKGRVVLSDGLVRC